MGVITYADDFTADRIADYHKPWGGGYHFGDVGGGRTGLIFPAASSLLIFDERNSLPPGWTRCRVWVSGSWTGDAGGTDTIAIGVGDPLAGDFVLPGITPGSGFALMIQGGAPPKAYLEIGDGAVNPGYTFDSHTRGAVTSFELLLDMVPGGLMNQTMTDRALVGSLGPPDPYVPDGTAITGSGITALGSPATMAGILARSLCPGLRLGIAHSASLTGWGYEIEIPPAKSSVAAGDYRNGMYQYDRAV